MRAFIAVILVAWVSNAEAREPHVIRVLKSQRRMELWVGNQLERSFSVGLGLAPLGDKEQRGDMRTPEGEFYVAMKHMSSDFHRFIGLSYPMPRHARLGVDRKLVDKRTATEVERAVAARQPPPQATKLGGYVGIHGGGAGSDWTWGCIAISDEEVEWLYGRIRVGDRIEVIP